MFPKKGTVDCVSTHSNAKGKSQHLLAKLIKERNWEAVSQRVRSHPHEILIQDCHGLNSLHNVVQSFYGTTTTSSLSLHNSVGRTYKGSICSIASTNITLPTLTDLLSSPFSHQGLIYQPPPLRMIISPTDELSSSFEVGATPLHLACRNTNTPDNVIKVIARTNSIALNLQDDDGDTPLHLALRYGFSEDVQQTLIELACKSTALRSSENDDATDFEGNVAFAKSDYEDGDLPLHVAISHDASLGTIQLLANAYPQGMFVKNHMQQTPLLVAYLCGRYDLVEKVILENDLVLEHLRDLLAIGGDKYGGGVQRPLFYLWEQVSSATEEVNSSADGIEAFEAISTLLTAATSNIVSVSNTAVYETTQNENHDKKLCYITLQGKNFLKLSFSEAYRLLLASISLGKGIIPPEYVSFLIQAHPGIVRKTEPSSGCTPLHIAAMQPHHRNLLGESATDCLANAAGRDKDPSSSCSFKIISSFSPSADDSLPKKSHSILQVILDAYPMAAYQQDNCGCLPFHLAIKSGMRWEDGMKDLFMMAPEALRAPDPMTGLYPFMLAASMKSGIRIDAIKDKADENFKSNDSLDEVFSLLRCAPDLVKSSCYSENYPMNEKTWRRGLLHMKIGGHTGNITTLITGKHMRKLDSSATIDLLHPKKRLRFPDS